MILGFLSKNRFFTLFLLVWGLIPILGIGQGGGRVDIINTDVFSQEEIDGRAVRKLLKNVHLRQDDTDFFCDSAYHYIDSNVVVAMSRVLMLMGRENKMSIRSDRLTYDGNRKIANLYNNITLKDSAVTLRTHRLTYYREQDYGKYFTGGTLENGANVLESREGYYYPQKEMAYFKRDVKLVSQDETDTVPDYTLLTDTLGYNTQTETALFMAPTRVYNDVNRIYTEAGYYDTQKKVAYFTKKAHLGDTSYSIYADTIFYDQENDKGLAKGHIILVEADSALTVYGGYAEFESEAENAFITDDDSTYAIQVFEDDTMFLFADTLFATADTSGQRVFHAYYKVKVFMNELQGICDSLIYFFEDSTILFQTDPVLWSGTNQILGDTLKIFLAKGMIDSMSIPKAAFIISEEDTVGYNQIKGKTLEAKFRNNELFRMWITGNSESIYYTKDDDEHYFGMNQAKCNQMRINFSENQPSRIVFDGKPDGTFFPIHEVLFQEKRLDGFTWRATERPLKPGNVFMIFPRDLPDSLNLPPEARPGITGIPEMIPDSLKGFSAEGGSVTIEVRFPEGFYIPKQKLDSNAKRPWKGLKGKKRKEVKAKWKAERKAERKKRRAEKKRLREEKKRKRKAKKQKQQGNESGGKLGVEKSE